MKALTLMFLFTGLFWLSACAEGGSRNPAEQNQEFGACKIFFNQTGYCANLIWDQVPDDESGGSFYLEFFEQANPTVPVAPPANPAVTVQMLEANQPPQIVSVEKKNFTQYFIQDANIKSRGPWEILVELRNSLGVLDAGIFKYNRL